MKGLQRKAMVLGQSPDLHVIREHYNDLVTGGQKGLQHKVVGFNRPDRYQDVLRCSALIEPRDVLPKLGYPIRVG